MKNVEQNGRSMVEMLGVLAVIGVLTVGSLGAYQKAMSKIALNKTTSAVVDALQSWSEFVLKKGGGNATFSSVNQIKSFLYPECESGNSSITPRQVCQLPLGEMYMKQTTGYYGYTSFMLFITLLDEDRNTCSQFLSQNWAEMMPTRIKKGSMIWAVSDQNKNGEIVLNEGEKKISVKKVAEVCDSVCSDSSKYCTIVFDMASKGSYSY